VRNFRDLAGWRCFRSLPARMKTCPRTAAPRCRCLSDHGRPDSPSIPVRRRSRLQMCRRRTVSACPTPNPVAYRNRRKSSYDGTYSVAALHFAAIRPVCHAAIALGAAHRLGVVGAPDCAARSSSAKPQWSSAIQRQGPLAAAACGPSIAVLG